MGGSTPDTDTVLLRQDGDIRSNNYCQVLGKNEWDTLLTVSEQKVYMPRFLSLSHHDSASSWMRFLHIINNLHFKIFDESESKPNIPNFCAQYIITSKFENFLQWLTILVMS